MNPHEMTLEQCCDYLMEANGWRIVDGEYPFVDPGGGAWPSNPHPFKSLDAIAGSLPEGYRWWGVGWGTNSPDCQGLVGDANGIDFAAWGDTEPLARARAAVLAWEAEKENANV